MATVDKYGSGNHSDENSVKSENISVIKKRRKVTYKLHDQKRISGFSQELTEEEIQLENRVFGGEDEIIENLNEVQPKKKRKRTKLDDESISSDESDFASDSDLKKREPAWEDDDDDNLLVRDKPDIFKKQPSTVSSAGNEKYATYAKKKFVTLMGAPKWADMEKDDEVTSEDESEDELLKRAGNLIAKSTSLPKGVIDVRNCRSLFEENSKGTIIKSVEFHPTSRVVLVAGLNGLASLFQVDGKKNCKIQSVHFGDFPIYSAHFSTDGYEIVVGSREVGAFFYYDMFAGKVIKVPVTRKMESKSVRSFCMSPDGKYIVVSGSYGQIHLLTATSKEWITTLKMNGEIGGITFNRDGSRMYSHGDTGEIYVWDMLSRRCIHKFCDEGCITGTAIALSPNEQYLAAGSDVGVVNIYDASKLLDTSNPIPMKRLMNLTTEVSSLKYNSTSELLAMASGHKNSALKLVHFPSMTVFSNFPRQGKNLRRINCLDLSLNSGYLATGTNGGYTSLYRLRHYMNY